MSLLIRGAKLEKDANILPHQVILIRESPRRSLTKLKTGILRCSINLRPVLEVAERSQLGDDASRFSPSITMTVSEWVEEYGPPWSSLRQSVLLMPPRP
ncbi:hypothetical protein QWA68_003869 [Fusarium oxysporum]|nr:hypothetical protein QWA68_003869 [Fusarium oxysporum]